uniref:Uncharacterized protein n=1 Tax=Oryza meridionalis TaxID=40149 RepID=A0A0E0EK32_9ORYZ
MASSPANVGNGAPASFCGNQTAAEVWAGSMSATAVTAWRSGGSSGGGGVRPEIGGGGGARGDRHGRGREHGRARRERKEGEVARGSDLEGTGGENVAGRTHDFVGDVGRRERERAGDSK